MIYWRTGVSNVIKRMWSYPHVNMCYKSANIIIVVVIIIINLSFCFFIIQKKVVRFNVAVHLFSNRSQKTSRCAKNISDTLT